MYPSEKAIVLSPDRNKNTSIELNNANMETLALIVFFHFCGEVKYFDASAGINGRNENFRDGSSFWSFLKPYTYMFTWTEIFQRALEVFSVESLKGRISL